MNELFTALDTATPTAVCPHCQNPFEPRTGSGGKAQKFCSEECRRKAQRAPTPPTPSPTPDIGATQVADEQPRISGPLKCGNVIDGVEPPEDFPPDYPFDPPARSTKPSTGVNYVADDYSWKADDIVLDEQKRTAIYWNVHGDAVIRQEGSYPDDDPYVVICRSNLFDFIDRLCDFAGIQSAGRRS